METGMPDRPMQTVRSAIAIIILGYMLFASMGICTVLADDGGLEALSRGGSCSFSANAALKAAFHEARDDYWIVAGKCCNLFDPVAMEECHEENRESLKESLDLGREQYAARKEVCGALGEAPYDPMVDTEQYIDFRAVIAGQAVLKPNRYFPLVPGYKRIYLVKDAAGKKLERIKVEVLSDSKEIVGVHCIVVRDRVWEFRHDGGKMLIEDTLDWYAQDFQGNVWYFGEIAKNFEEGELVDLEGSWKAGRDMEMPGIIMFKDPREGEIYRQEFSLGNAEDMAEVVGYVQELAVGGKVYHDVLQTRDYSPIDPGVFEFKYYAPGVGMVLEEKPVDGERVELKHVVLP